MITCMRLMLYMQVVDTGCTRHSRHKSTLAAVLCGKVCTSSLAMVFLCGGQLLYTQQSCHDTLRVAVRKYVVVYTFKDSGRPKCSSDRPTKIPMPLPRFSPAPIDKIRAVCRLVQSQRRRTCTLRHCKLHTLGNPSNLYRLP